jgi:hypothetical protein
VQRDPKVIDAYLGGSVGHKTKADDSGNATQSEAA